MTLPKSLLHRCARYLLPCAVLLSTACKDKTLFRLTGEIAHLQQADLYIYSTDGALDHIDTIHVQDGLFEWQTTLGDNATFQLVYPNFSELAILASPGDRITMSGDAGQLKLTHVEGSPDNEELTRFRLAHNGDSEPQLRQALLDYIKSHEGSRVSIQLQRELTRMNARPSGLRIGQQLPAVELPDDGISPADSLPATARSPRLIIFWAGWSHASHEVNAQLRLFRHTHPAAQDSTRLQPVSISLDVDKTLYYLYLRQDSITWPTRCYRRVWDTPLAYQFAIRQLPYMILADSAQTIVAMGSSWDQDIRPQLERMYPAGL